MDENKKRLDAILKPDVGLLIKLGSIIVHYEEYNSSNGHFLDLQTVESLMEEEDVKEWFEGMSKMALLPQKRNK